MNLIFKPSTETSNLGKSVIQILKESALDDDKSFFEKLEANEEDFNMLRPYSTSKTAKKIFQSISSVRPELITKLSQIYHWDFELFGYSVDDYILR